METFQDVFRGLEEDLSMGWLSYPVSDIEAKTWSNEHTRYEITLDYNGNTMFVDYFSSRVLSDESVLYSVVMDARAGQGKNFEEFCEECGYNDDSIKALKTYEECKANAERLRALLGDSVYNRFILCEM